MKIKFKPIYIAVIASCIIGIFIGIFFNPLVSGDSVFSGIKKFDFVLNTAFRNYVDEVDSHKLVESAIEGMLGELDVHSVYISQEEMKQVNEDFSATFEGIGVEFDVIHDTITIISPIPGGPSEALGIRSGDKIIKIDGVTAIGLHRDEVPKKLKGPKGTKVTIDVKRTGVAKLFTFEITRDKIPFFTVDASFLLDGTDIGVVVINRFAATTYDEMIKALRQLRAEGMKKLIIDLRLNPGGYLNQAFFVADEFLKGGDTIVYTKGRLPEFSEVFKSTPGGEFENIPLIVLVNEGSASASEIVSGAVQDLDRGIIVGTTTFGKGLVQTQYEVGDGSTFRLTTAKYYTPSGRCIQRPYKDKDKYFHLAGRLDLGEGNYVINSVDKIKEYIVKPKSEKQGFIIDSPKNINNAKENIKEHIDVSKKPKGDINLDSLPIYYTKGGRLVLGSGGIIPDIIVDMDTLTDLGVNIRIKNIFNEFINDYVDIKEIKKTWGGDFQKFLRNFKAPQSMMDDFKKLAVSKGVDWKDSDFEIDKHYLYLSLKAYVARALWNRNEFLQVFFTMDTQLKKAAESFPELGKISSLKKK